MFLGGFPCYYQGTDRQEKKKPVIIKIKNNKKYKIKIKTKMSHFLVQPG